MKHQKTGRSLSRLWILSILPLSAGAHDPISTPLTWSREISRIVYHRCASCHRPGGEAMSLLTYADARPWAVAISEEAANRRMPPWDAVKGFGEFRNEQALTQDEIEDLTNWAAGGAPEGDTAWLPALPSPVPGAQPPSARRTVRLNGSLVLSTGATLAAIRPAGLAPGASVQVLAFRPDGSVEPLLWVSNFRSRYAHLYAFLHPIALPKGTRVQTIPATGTFELTLQPR